MPEAPKARYVTQERFYEHLRMTREKHVSIEIMLHYAPDPSSRIVLHVHRDLPAEPELRKLDALPISLPVDFKRFRSGIDQRRL